MKRSGITKERGWVQGTPLLGKGGVAAPIKKKSRSLLSGLTLRAAPFKGRGHLLDGAATPPLPRRGVPGTHGVKCVPTILRTSATNTNTFSTTHRPAAHARGIAANG